MAELVCGTGDRDAWLAARREGITVTDVPGPPEYEPDDAEAQRIAEVFADARAEFDSGWF